MVPLSVSALFLAGVASGQGVTVRGLAYDSLHSRPLAGAFVAIGARVATADSLGRFVIPNVPVGIYRITAQHDAIDQIGMSAVGMQLRVDSAMQKVVTVALPSFNTLWRQVCGLSIPRADTGFVFGTVRSARQAIVSASWIDVTVAGTKISQKQKTLEIAADSLGNFALCGVPTTTGLTLHAVADSVISGSYDIAPMEPERVARRDIAIAQPRATLSGRVLADSGRGPIGNAELVLVDLGASTTSNDRGDFVFTQLPAGTHRLYVRKIGYAETTVTIELAEAEKGERDVVLNRVTVLDSMQVKAKFTPREEAMRVFEENRKIGLGKFITQAQLDSANGRILPQLLLMLPGLRVWQERMGPEAGKYKAAMDGRGIKSFGSRGTVACALVVFVDGIAVRDYDLNEYAPSAIAGIEYYRGGAQTPPEYARLNTGCGVIAIHLRK